METIIPILIFILILGIVIFIHELGHFLAARWAGIFVEEFALGMGPKILSKKGKKKSLDGEVTLYSLRAFPVGGFCKLRGQDNELADDPEALNNKPIGSRFLVMAGGSIMNFLLAFVLFFILVMLRGYHVIDVVDLTEGMPAYEAGLRVGDRITHINGTRVEFQEDFITVINATGGRQVDIRITRDGERHNFLITPLRGEERYIIGITISIGRLSGLLDERPADHEIPFRRVQIGDGIVNAAEMIVFHIRAPFSLIARLVVGDPIPEGGGIMGPIGIGGVVTEIYQVTIQRGFMDMLLMMVFFTALLNAALGVMNLLPIPALDGARLVFLLIEAVRRKPVPPEKEAMVHMVGLVFLLVVALFIAYQDIARLVNLNDYPG